MDLVAHVSIVEPSNTPIGTTGPPFLNTTEPTDFDTTVGPYIRTSNITESDGTD